MRTFFKTLISGALGIGALYVVGKVCYEAGKEMAEVERQLAVKKAEMEKNDVKGGEQLTMDIDEAAESDSVDFEPEKKEHSDYTISEEEFNDIWERHTEYTAFGKLINRIRDKTQGLRTLIRARKTLSEKSKSPGVLGTLLKNPDGAKIEACIMNGGVRINVTPKASGSS
jgi:hypothetical protein